MVPDQSDLLRNSRTTRARWWERLLLAPNLVNYHYEHHLMMTVPHHNLPKLHRILRNGPHGPRMEIAPSYAAVLRKATARPNHEDRPGELVHGLRRHANANENSAKAGF